jgi:hypothetical protein
MTGVAGSEHIVGWQIQVSMVIELIGHLRFPSGVIKLYGEATNQIITICRVTHMKHSCQRGFF